MDKVAKERGKEAARNMKASKLFNPVGGVQAMLMEYRRQRDQMHRLAQDGNREAAKQEAFLNGFLSQWD
jgi:hypothetical protein